MKTVTCAVAVAAAGTAFGQGMVDFDGNDVGLVSYTNSAIVDNGTTNGNLIDGEQYVSYTSSGDAFNPMSRAALGPVEADGDQVGMPFGISDDSVEAATGNSVFEPDDQGFAGIAQNENGFFGVIDTVNSDGPGTETAEFVFDIAGLTGIVVSADFAAMGDFESSDVFNFEYSIDGGAFSPLFTSSVDEAGSMMYAMDNAANNPVILDDPLAINGTLLNDEFQTLSAAVAGTGSELAIRFTASSNGGSEAFGFDNLAVVPSPGAAALLGLGGLFAARRRRG